MPPPNIDARRVRFAQGLSAVLVLAGFVFGLGWLLPLVGLTLAAGAIWGPPAHLGYVLFDVTAGSRVGEPREWETPADARFADAFGAVSLGLATLPWLAGLTWIAWLLGLGYAAVASVAATTGASLPRAIKARLDERG